MLSYHRSDWNRPLINNIVPRQVTRHFLSQLIDSVCSWAASYPFKRVIIGFHSLRG